MVQWLLKTKLHINSDISKVGLTAIGKTGSGCSKLTKSLVKVSLKLQTSVSEIHHYFLLEKNVRSFCIAKASLIFSTKKYQCIGL